MSRGTVVWITGFPASGKSTFAEHLQKQLQTLGINACVLDGDAVRACLASPLGYDEAGRAAFYETLGRLAALLSGQGLTVLVPATANRRAYREGARARAPRFIEVFLDVDRAECERRDPKGLYAQSRQGRIDTLPGGEAEYERPLTPDLVGRGGDDLDAVARVITMLCASPRVEGAEVSS